MFLLMGVGYIVAGSVLFSEIVGGCAQRCRQFARRNSTLTSIKSSFHQNTSAQPSATSHSQTHLIAPEFQSTESRKSSIFMRFRRKSDQTQTVCNEGTVSKHKRNNSLVGGVSRKMSSRRSSLDQIDDVQQTDEDLAEDLTEIAIPSRGDKENEVGTLIDVHRNMEADDKYLETGGGYDPSLKQDGITGEDAFGEKLGDYKVY